MLNKIKLLLGITDDSKDQLITLLIEQASQEAYDFTHNNDVRDDDSLITDMVVWKYNRLGTEGVDSESYSGASFHYSSTYPTGLQARLRAYRRIRVL